jgi:pre-mRNA-splicing factor 18
MKTMEEMEANMRLDDLKQKGAGNEEKKISKKSTLVVEPIQIELLQTDIEKLYSQIYAYFTVSKTIMTIEKKRETDVDYNSML